MGRYLGLRALAGALVLGWCVTVAGAAVATPENAVADDAPATVEIPPTQATANVVVDQDAVVVGEQTANVTPFNGAVDYIKVEKGQRRMTLYHRGEAVRTYPIRLGKNPVGPKSREGDGRTPEGIYYIEGRKPDSAFHRSLKISYPAPKDLEVASAQGMRPGGQIMIHGIAVENEKTLRIHKYIDWTNGCIAVTNREIEEIWALVPDGTPIDIRP